MKHFKVAQPETLEQASSVMAEAGAGSFVLAGGTDLLGEVKTGIVEPEVLVDLKSVPGLASIGRNKKGIRIGAMTSVTDLAENEEIRKNYLGLHEAAKSVATPQLRNMGTVGGNLCQRPRCWYYRDFQVLCRKKGGSKCYAYSGRNKYHAIFGGGPCYIVHPSDLAPMFVALGADVVLNTPKGEKTLAAKDFFVLPKTHLRKENVLVPGEIVREIRLPWPRPSEKSTYIKFKERAAWDFAVVSVAIWADVLGDVFNDVRIVLGGVAPAPWRLERAESMVKGKKVTENLLKQAAKEELKDARPLEENSSKAALVETLVPKAALALI